MRWLGCSSPAPAEPGPGAVSLAGGFGAALGLEVGFSLATVLVLGVPVFVPVLGVSLFFMVEKYLKLALVVLQESLKRSRQD